MSYKLTKKWDYELAETIYTLWVEKCTGLYDWKYEKVGDGDIDWATRNYKHNPYIKIDEVPEVEKRSRVAEYHGEYNED